MDITVPFVKEDDDSQEVLPLRIKYHPGIVLEVVQMDSGRGSGGNTRLNASSDAADLIRSCDTAGNPDRDTHFYHDNATEAISISQQTTKESTVMDDTIDGCQLASALEMNLSVRSQLLAQIKHYGSHIEAMISSEAMRVSGVQNTINQLLKIMRYEISEDKNIQDQFLQMKELVHCLVQSMQDRKETQSVNLQQLERDISEKQQQILQRQIRDIDHLVTIQECVQDAATLALALHEHSVPRLFVVLPRVATHPDQREALLPDQFRLFFLCECGHQSRTEGRPDSPNIHMARHEGYDLENTEEFFDNYSLYLLSVIHILKNGINAPGINIPSVSHLRLAEGVHEVQDVLDLTGNTLQSLLNETISFIREQSPVYQMNKANSEVILSMLDSSDLRSVIRFLKGYDEQLGHAPGNLRQTLMPEGDVKWVCVDHYLERQIEVVAQPQETDTLGTDHEDIEELARLMIIQDHDKIVDMTVLLDSLDTRWIVREKAIGTCQGRPELDESILQTLIGAVKDEHCSVREAAVRMLGGPSEVSNAALRAVISAVNDSYWNVKEAAVDVLESLSEKSRNAAIRILGSQADVSESVIQALVAGLQVEDRTVQTVAVQELSGQAELPQYAVQTYIGMLTHDRLNVREAAAKVLGGQNMLSEVSVMTLINNLTDERWYVREVSVRILSGHDEWSVAVVEALVGTVLDENASVRVAVVRALASELPEESIQTLLEDLQSGDWGTKEAALRVLGSQRSTSGAPIEALIISLRE
ncbi:hypothetical protein BGZ65_011772 [Modicella reniformis]|uniref:Uncharacterized protein n=1 Tax=Modicella reniformis TaxID=1440133 RepID=A0A9P6M1R4_9FUNG|nr:hypothetical protein BGZ65_011772 [Modicella reniformis]